MDARQISAGLTCRSAELSQTAKAARAVLARAGSGYSRVLGARSLPCLTGAGRLAWDLLGAGPAWQDVLKERSEYELLPFSHTPPSYFFFMKTFTRNLISDRGSKFHARIYFTKHVIFRGQRRLIKTIL